MPDKQKICFLIIITLISSIACTKEKDSIYDANEKSSSVPAEAFFVGGVDGGVYIYLKKSPCNRIKNIYYAEIYSDHTGELWYKGSMTMAPSDDQNLNIPQIIELIQGWDGNQLLLKNGLTLKATESLPQD